MLCFILSTTQCIMIRYNIYTIQHPIFMSLISKQFCKHKSKQFCKQFCMIYSVEDSSLIDTTCMTEMNIMEVSQIVRNGARENV